jgi:hypothetical protein
MTVSIKSTPLKALSKPLLPTTKLFFPNDSGISVTKKNVSMEIEEIISDLMILQNDLRYVNKFWISYDKISSKYSISRSLTKKKMSLVKKLLIRPNY